MRGRSLWAGAVDRDSVAATHTRKMAPATSIERGQQKGRSREPQGINRCCFLLFSDFSQYALSIPRCFVPKYLIDWTKTNMYQNTISHPVFKFHFFGTFVCFLFRYFCRLFQILTNLFLIAFQHPHNFLCRFRYFRTNICKFGFKSRKFTRIL